MKNKTWLEKMLDSVKDSFEFRLEKIILDLTEQICKRMQDRQITRTQLARDLNVSPAAVTQILNGNSNFTLRTLLSFADALNLDLGIEFRPKEISAQGSLEDMDMGWRGARTKDMGWQGTKCDNHNSLGFWFISDFAQCRIKCQAN